MLWAGHASLIDEVVEAGVTPDAVVRRDSPDTLTPAILNRIVAIFFHRAHLCELFSTLLRPQIRCAL